MFNKGAANEHLELKTIQELLSENEVNFFVLLSQILKL